MAGNIPDKIPLVLPDTPLVSDHTTVTHSIHLTLSLRGTGMSLLENKATFPELRHFFKLDPHNLKRNILMTYINGLNSPITHNTPVSSGQGCVACGSYQSSAGSDNYFSTTPLKGIDLSELIQQFLAILQGTSGSEGSNHSGYNDTTGSGPSYGNDSGISSHRNDRSETITGHDRGEQSDNHHSSGDHHHFGGHHGGSGSDGGHVDGGGHGHFGGHHGGSSSGGGYVDGGHGHFGGHHGGSGSGDGCMEGNPGGCIGGNYGYFGGHHGGSGGGYVGGSHGHSGGHHGGSS